MTKQELIALCEKYDGSKEQFSTIVGEFVKLEQEKIEYIFYIGMLSMMKKWSAGRSTPPPYSRKVLVKRFLAYLQQP